MESDNIEEKQKYLRQNILQSGYDPSDFITFLEQNENIDHIDIEGWSMAKIQKLVTAYKQYKYYMAQESNTAQQSTTQQKKRIFSQKQQKPQKETNERKTLSQKSITSSTMLLSTQGGKMVYEKQKMTYYQQQKSKIEYPRYNTIFDYEFVGKCKCVKADNLINQDIHIQVPRFEIVESAGFLSSIIGAKTDIWYVIKSNIKKQTVVKRLLQDFDWLSAALIRLYPYLSLPQLCQHRKQQQNPNQKRRIQIQQYLQTVCRRKQLYQSSLLYDFLTAHSDKMEKIKKSYDTMGFAKGVSLLKTESGEVEVEYTKRAREFQDACHQYSKKIHAIHQKFPQSLTKTIQSMQTVVTNINCLVDYFAQLYESYNQVMNKFPQYKSPQYNQILVNMNNLCLGLSENIKGHASTLEKHLKDYFRVNLMNDKNMIRLEKYVKEEEKLYLDYKYNLMRKKQRLLAEPEKWDIDIKSFSPQVINELKSNKQKAYQIMLPRQTQQQQQIKSWIAYLYTRFGHEFGIYIKESTWRYAARYKMLATDLLTNDKNYLEALTKFLSESRKLVK